MRKFSVLVVDDEECIVESLQNFLEKSEYDVKTALCGEKAIEKLCSSCFDLVITDLVLGGINGIEVLKEAKKNNPKVCVFILSGHGTISSAVEAMQLGANDFILKPYDADGLLLKIRHFFENQEELQNISQIINSPLTICRECRKVRDDTGKNFDTGEWGRLEVYLNNHCGGVDVSHDYCPACLDNCEIIDVLE